MIESGLRVMFDKNVAIYIHTISICVYTTKTVSMHTWSSKNTGEARERTPAVPATSESQQAPRDVVSIPFDDGIVHPSIWVMV